jgi:hypothetical protein
VDDQPEPLPKRQQRGPQPKISRAQLRDMADRGLTRTQAASETHVSYQTITNAIDRYEIPLLPIRGAQARQEAQRLRRNGVPVNEIAAALGCHPISVYRYLRPPDSIKPRRSGGRYADVVATATDHPDMTPAQIAATLGGITARGVAYHLQNARQHGDLTTSASRTNWLARFFPQTTDDERPTIQVAGVRVAVYVVADTDEEATLVVSVDTDTAAKWLQRRDENHTVPLVITMQDTTVFQA